MRRSEIGKFIAENLVRDEPRSKVADYRTAKILGMDLLQVAKAGVDVFAHEENSVQLATLVQTLTKAAAEDNLVGSAGEFGLLMAFLANSPNTVQLRVDLLDLVTEPAVSVDDLTLMFGGGTERRFPEGWDTWKKTSSDWVVSTLLLAFTAAQQHIAIKSGTACNTS